MLELLTRFKMFLDLGSITDWETNASWTANLYNEYKSFKHTVTSDGTIKRNILELNKKYKINFTIVMNEDASSNSFSLGCGDSYVDFELGGTYETFLTCTNNTYFSLIASIDTPVTIYNITIEEIGFQSLDLFGDEDILLNIGIKDVKEYGQNIDTFSRVFKLPGTPKNNRFFKNMFNINEDGIYDFNQIVDASIVIDGQTIKNGVIRLDNIVKSGSFFNYETTFSGEILGLFADAGETKLEELDYSDINRVITDDWVTSNNQLFGAVSFPPHPEYQNFCFPYICYGYYPFEGIKGRAWETSDISYGLLVSDLYPAISLKYLFTKCLSTFGYTFDSTTFDNNNFEKMIIPFCNAEEKLNQFYDTAVITYKNWTVGNINDSMCTNEILTNGTYSSGSVAITNTDGTFSDALIIAKYDGILSSTDIDVIVDKLHCYNGSYGYPYGEIPGTYTCRKTGKHKLKVTLKINSATVSNPVYVWAFKVPKAQVTAQSWGYYDEASTSYYISSCPKPELIYKFESSSGGLVTKEITMDCNKDDIIGVKIFYSTTVGSANMGYLQKVVIQENGYGNGVYVDFKNVVPENVKVTDFLKDIFKMFNLFIKVDDDNPKKLLIENYENFYSGKTINLSSKIDYNSEVKISMPKDYAAKQLILKYKEDTDTFNKYYNNIISDRTYGHKFLELNKFSEDDIFEINLDVFAPTPLVDFSIDTETNIRQFVYSNISTYDKTQQAITYTHNTKTTPRILFYKNTSIDSSYKKFNFEATEYSTYPYAGHLLYPLSINDVSQSDLNFQTLTEINNQSSLFFTPDLSGMTNVNLYNIYYKNYLLNYIDKQSRLVECYAYLNIYDIQNIKLNDVIQIDDTNYHINKIIDFNCNQKGQVTKLELLRIIDNLSYNKFEYNSILGTHNTSLLNNNLVIGQNNTLTEVGSIVLGSNNTVVGSEPAFILGSNNTSNGSVLIGNNLVSKENGNIIIGANNVALKSGVTNAIVIGTTTSTIQSNRTQLGQVVIVNGQVYTTGGLNDEGLDTLQKDFSNPYKNDPGINSNYKMVDNSVNKWNSNVKNDPNLD